MSKGESRELVAILFDEYDRLGTLDLGILSMGYEPTLKKC
jgi:hypothetical protein